LAWLGLVIADHRRRPDRLGTFVHRTDPIVRLGLVVGLLAVAGYTVVAQHPFNVSTNPVWLAGKVAAYAVCIACGVAIRVRLAQFGPAWAALVAGGNAGRGAASRALLAGNAAVLYAMWALVVGRGARRRQARLDRREPTDDGADRGDPTAHRDHLHVVRVRGCRASTRLDDSVTVWDVFTPELIVGGRAAFHARDRAQMQARGRLHLDVGPATIDVHRDVAWARYVVTFRYEPPGEASAGFSPTSC
jgi:hypothetical protein